MRADWKSFCKRYERTHTTRLLFVIYEFDFWIRFEIRFRCSFSIIENQQLGDRRFCWLRLQLKYQNEKVLFSFKQVPIKVLLMLQTKFEPFLEFFMSTKSLPAIIITSHTPSSKTLDAARSIYPQKYGLQKVQKLVSLRLQRFCFGSQTRNGKYKEFSVFCIRPPDGNSHCAYVTTFYVRKCDRFCFDQY